MLRNNLKFCAFLLLLACDFARAVSLVTTSPQVTELVHQLGKYRDVGAGSAVPGSDITPPSIGTLFLPSLEKVIAIRADWLLLDTEAVPRYLASRFERHSAQVINFQLTDPEKLFAQSKQLMKAVYNSEPPEIWQRARRCYDAFSGTPSFTYLAVVWVAPLTVFGQQTFLSRWLQRLGGVNLTPPTPWNAYPALTEEWLTRHLPDRLYVFADIPHAVETVRKKADLYWPGHKPKIIVIETNHFARANFGVFEHLNELQLPTALPADCVRGPRQ